MRPAIARRMTGPSRWLVVIEYRLHISAEPKIGELLSAAGIPNYPTGGDAVRGFMHLVRHREVVETLAQVPPAMPGAFAPDIDAARGIAAAAVADGRQWLDPVEVKRLLDAYEIPMVPAFAARFWRAIRTFGFCHSRPLSTDRPGKIINKVDSVRSSSGALLPDRRVDARNALTVFDRLQENARYNVRRNRGV